MISEDFMVNFGHIANAPSGVGKLRDLVYHFAFSGELVPHSRESAAQLANVLALRESPTGRTRRAMLEPAAGFYSIPPHWLWVNIGDVGHDWGQTTPSDDFTYIDVSAIDNQRGVVAEGASIVSAAHAPSRARKVVKKGTVVYSTVRPYLLNIAVIEQDFDPAPIASTAFAVLHPYDGVEAKFIYYFLRSPAFVAYVEGVQSGIAYPAISDQNFFAASFPLAPTEEQKRIVTKVDELMTLCGQLEAQQQERERRFPVLSRTCHARFAEAPTQANLNCIFDETGDVSPADLRSTILSLAVHGRISKRHPSDSSVESTVPALASRALRSKDKRYPAHWLQVKLGDVGMWKGGGTPSKSVSQYWSGTTPWVSPKDMKKLRISDAEDHISEAAIEGSAVQLIPEKSLLMVVRGMILARAFPVALTSRAVTINQDMKALLPHDPDTAEYLLFALRALEPVVLASIERSSHGTCKLLTEALHALPIPIPPLAEQNRIVAKVDELMSLVDHLEAQQRERDKLADAFAKASVASFTGATQIERPAKMKAPKTELVSIVTLGKKPKPDAKAPLAKLLTRHKGILPAKSLWQQSGLTIDAFYQQLKTEIARGWIAPPAEAEMKVREDA